MPIFFSLVPKVKPGVPFSTMKAEMPFVPFEGSVMAKTMYISASLPLVIKIFEPFRTYSSPSKTALVACPEASVPAFGSVSAKAPSFSPLARGFKYSSFCAGVPYLSMGSQQSEVCAEIITPVVAQRLDISSTHMTYVRLSQP